MAASSGPVVGAAGAAGAARTAAAAGPTLRPRSDPRLRAPLALFLALVALFVLERLAILLGMGGRFRGIPASDWLASFLASWRFDLSAAALLTLPLLPAALLPRRIAAAGPARCLVAGYCAATLAFALLAMITDYYFFAQFGERLNHRALEYAFVDYAWRLMRERFPVAGALALGAAALAAAFAIFARVVLRAPGGPAAAASGPRRRELGRTAALAGLLALALHGSLGPRALDAGPAQFPSSPALTQLTLNGLFTLRRAAEDFLWPSRSLGSRLRLLPEGEALAVAARAVRRPGDRPLGDRRNPLRRATDTGRPRRDLNVVLVVMESYSWQFVGAMGGDASLSPCLDAIIGGSVLMDRCFAVGTRSPNGCSGLLCGFPDLPGRSVSCRRESEGRFLTLGSVLRARGYETVFVSGCDPLDDNRRPFLAGNGYSRTVFGGDFATTTYRNELGCCDGDVFDQARREIAAVGERPFLVTVVTNSFHPNYHFPAGRVAPVDPADPHRVEKDCQRYADWAIGRFMDQARREPWYGRTIFVFAADHGGHAIPVEGFAGHRIPFVIHAPAILAPRRVSAVCSQTDVAPTVLSLLGGSYEHCFFGSSVLDRPPEAGWALMERVGELGLMDADGELLVVPYGAAPRLMRFSTPAELGAPPAGAASPEKIEELRRRAVALLQTASIVYERGAYNLK